VIAAGLLSCVFLAAAITADAQFQIVGPAPASPAVARQQIRTLLERVDPDNSPRTIKTLSGLTPWFRDILDEELIAAWRKDGRANLAPVIEPLADPRVAAGIVEFSWRQQRQATFTPAYAPMLGHLMARYPDSAQPFLDDLLGSTATGQHALDLSQPEVQAVCRILIDMADVRRWKKNALQILLHYRQEAKALLDKDMQGDDAEERDRASSWLADLAAADFAAGAQPSPAKDRENRGAQPPASLYRPGSGVTAPTPLTRVEPVYSEIARKLRVQGVVGLQLAIAADGTPQNFRILRPVGYGLDEKAIEAVQQWRFNPGMKDGKAVAVVATVQVTFRLLAGTAWAAGPMVFAPAAGVTPPVVEDGAMPKPGTEVSDESVVLEFTVGMSGSVNSIHTIHGSESASELLTGNLAAWTFRPAMNANGPVEAIGRIRFLKGQGDEDAKLPLTPPLAQGKPRQSDHDTEHDTERAMANGADIGASDPKLLHKVEADYSEAGRAAGVQGVVVLRIVVDADGNVATPTVITSLGWGLDEKAIEAVKQWKFTPGYRDGKPVAVPKTVEISFALQ
jgi:TonB family protein